MTLSTPISLARTNPFLLILEQMVVFVGGYVLTLDVLIAVCRLKTVCSVLVDLIVILLEVCELSERGTNFLFWKIMVLIN